MAKKTDKPSNGLLGKIVLFLQEHYLTRNLIFLMLTFLVLILVVKIALNIYTRHGERIEMPNLINKSMNEVKDIADKQSFDVIIYDSVQIVGKPGGIVLTQNPPSGSYVKRGRKIYLTTTKSEPDRFAAKLLPTLYGKKFSLKRKEIKDRFSVEMKIKGYKYDPGPVDHILEVYYKGRPIVNRRGRNLKVEIAKGDTLQVILSKQGGGEVAIPDLRCMSLTEAKFLAESRKLKIGKVTEMGGVSDAETAYVVTQFPQYKADTKMPMGATIDLAIVQQKPTDCP